MGNSLDAIRAAVKRDKEAAAKRAAEYQAKKSQEDRYNAAWRLAIDECHLIDQDKGRIPDLSPFRMLAEIFKECGKHHWLEEMRQNFTEWLAAYEASNPGLPRDWREGDKQAELFFVTAMIELEGDSAPSMSSSRESGRRLPILPSS